MLALSELFLLWLAESANCSRPAPLTPVLLALPLLPLDVLTSCEAGAMVSAAAELPALAGISLIRDAKEPFFAKKGNRLLPM